MKGIQIDDNSDISNHEDRLKKIMLGIKYNHEKVQNFKDKKIEFDLRKGDKVFLFDNGEYYQNESLKNTLQIEMIYKKMTDESLQLVGIVHIGAKLLLCSNIIV
jgi:hypothetical protein